MKNLKIKWKNMLVILKKKTPICKVCFWDKRRTGRLGIPDAYWRRVNSNARNRNREVGISRDEALQLFLTTGRRCRFTNREIGFGTCGENGRKANITASLDRIDSSMSYVSGNVQWVHKRINEAKGEQSDLDYIRECCEVADHCRWELAAAAA